MTALLGILGVVNQRWGNLPGRSNNPKYESQFSYAAAKGGEPPPVGIFEQQKCGELMPPLAASLVAELQGAGESAAA